MDHKPSSSRIINERRDFFRIEDKVLMRCRAVDQSSALSNLIPVQFKDDPAFTLMQQLQQLDLDNSQFLRAIAEESRDLEAYLKGINKKIELISSHLLESVEKDPDQQKQSISLSEGGLGFHSALEYAHDSYLAMQLTFLPSHVTIVVFAKIINCTEIEDGHAIAVSFVHLNTTNRKLIAKHIMQLQLAQRRQKSNDE